MSTQYKNVEERQMQALSIGERRKRLRLSQQRVAELARCSLARVGQLEREAEPSGDVFERIVAVLTRGEQGELPSEETSWVGDDALPDGNHGLPAVA